MQNKKKIAIFSLLDNRLVEIVEGLIWRTHDPEISVVRYKGQMIFAWHPDHCGDIDLSGTDADLVCMA